MDPPPDPATAERIDAARRLLEDARGKGVLLRDRIASLSEATAWRARAMERFREGMACLEDDLLRMLRGIDAAERDLGRPGGVGDVSALFGSGGG